MDFKCYSDGNIVKKFGKLDDAFEFAEDDESVDAISFTLPTDEEVMLSREDLDEWVYDPLALDKNEARILNHQLAEINAGREEESDQRDDQAVDDLIDRKFLYSEIRSINGEEWDYYTINDLGRLALKKFQKAKSG